MLPIIKRTKAHSILGSLSCRAHSASSSAKSRRVVVTGTGVVSPLGIGTEQTWNSLLKCENGISEIKDDAFQSIPCRVAAFVPGIDKYLEEHFTKSQIRILSKSSLYALIAAKEAIEHSGWKGDNLKENQRAGVAIGSGMVDFAEIGSAWKQLTEDGYGRLSPHFITRVLLNLPAGHVAMTYGLRGPNHTVSTACTTGAHSIGDAFNFIRNNVCDLMVAGGVETPINPLSLAAFCRIRALCIKYNQSPSESSRPFDLDRCGFVMGEGSAIVVLEELEHARKRGANILGEVIGYGLSGDAHHVTAPREDGQGAIDCMRNAILDSGIDPQEVGHINCHATSTPLGDQIELDAIKSLFGPKLAKNIAITATKSSTGHLLGAAGALEATIALLSTKYAIIPPTLNLNNPIDKEMNIAANKPTTWPTLSENKRRIALSNSFGFGGTNATLAISNFIE